MKIIKLSHKKNYVDFLIYELKILDMHLPLLQLKNQLLMKYRQSPMNSSLLLIMFIYSIGLFIYLFIQNSCLFSKFNTQNTSTKSQLATRASTHNMVVFKLVWFEKTLFQRLYIQKKQMKPKTLSCLKRGIITTLIHSICHSKKEV